MPDRRRLDLRRLAARRGAYLLPLLAVLAMSLLAPGSIMHERLLHDEVERHCAGDHGDSGPSCCADTESAVDPHDCVLCLVAKRWIPDGEAGEAFRAALPDGGAPVRPLPDRRTRGGRSPAQPRAPPSHS